MMPVRAMRGRATARRAMQIGRSGHGSKLNTV